jgi:hypothetical protein
MGACEELDLFSQIAYRAHLILETVIYAMKVGLCKKPFGQVGFSKKPIKVVLT